MPFFATTPYENITGQSSVLTNLPMLPQHHVSQARYLVDHDPAMPLWQVALVAGVHFLGYYIFRGANR